MTGLISVLPVNSSVITYGNPVLTYLYPKVMDLYRSGVAYLSQMLDGVNGTEISAKLLRNGFEYILLPSFSSSQWGTFQDLLDGTPVLQRVLAAPKVVAVQGFTDWTLYHITP